MQDCTDRAILAGGVHGLKQEDDAFFLFGIQFLLEFIDFLVVLIQLLCGFFLVFAHVGFTGGSLIDPEFLTAVKAILR